MSKYKVFNKQKAQPKSLLYSGNVPYTMKLTRQPAIVALIAGFRMEAYFSAIKSLWNSSMIYNKILFIYGKLFHNYGIKWYKWWLLDSLCLTKTSLHYSCCSLSFLSCFSSARANCFVEKARLGAPCWILRGDSVRSTGHRPGRVESSVEVVLCRNGALVLRILIHV